LTNKYNIWASTLDKADVDVMHDRIKNGANLLEEHCFQFDFLNDEFDKLPDDLQKVIKNTPEKLMVYINPPYAEGDAKIGRGRKGIHESKIHNKYQKVLGKASSEIFILFFARAYKEIQDCKIANFATLKTLTAPNFAMVRENFQAKLGKLFIVLANTFDNVNGDFPIGFHIWDTAKKEKFTEAAADVYDIYGEHLQRKTFFSYDNSKYISDWLEENSKSISNFVGHLASVGNDFQHQMDVYIDDVNRKRIAGGRHTMISMENLICISVYFAVRHCIEHTWINHNDQFLYPNEKWEKDSEFQSDCFAFTLFHGKNNISSKFGMNYWIPFTEIEVNARNKFESNFMTDFIKGKVKAEKSEHGLFNHPCPSIGGEFVPLKFSAEAKAVFDAGRKLWRYYHSFPSHGGAGVVVNASFYDIREYFQGRNDKGKMNNKSTDMKYNELIGNLREKMKGLAKKIEPKVYEYGFLRG